MRRLLFLLSLVYLWTVVGHAQVVGPGFVNYVTSAPSGTCSQGAPAQIVMGSGDIYTCQSGTWGKGGGSGGGTVTSIATTAPIAGGTITTTGTISITGAAGAVLAGAGPAFTATPSLGTDNSVAGTLTLANGSAAAHTIFGSAATTTNTILGFATVPTASDVLVCAVSSTTCTLTDSGVLYTSLAPKASPTFTGTVTLPLLATTTKCAAAGTAANPSVAACSAAPSGSFSCATNASTGTCQVSSTAVTSASAIFVQPDSSLGSLLSVTCNTSADTGLLAPRVSARSNGVSFTITLGTYASNPLCFNYWVVN